MIRHQASRRARAEGRVASPNRQQDQNLDHLLEALERNDVARLPGATSAARSCAYAMEVGLDPETTIQEFIAQFPHDSVPPGIRHPPGRGFREPRKRSPDGNHGAVDIGDQHPSGRCGNLLQHDQPANAGRVGIAPAAVSPNRKRARAGSRGRTVANRLTARDSAARYATVCGAATGFDAAATPVQPADGVSDRLTIGLSARRPVWVSATVDGQQTISRLLQAGEKQTIDVKREMVITAGDAAALALTLNGANGRPLGKAAEVVTVPINLTNYKDYLAR